MIVASTPVEEIQIAAPEGASHDEGPAKTSPASSGGRLIAVRPYCGAEEVTVLALQDSRLEDAYIHGQPMAAWVDAGLASHMQGFCGLVPSASSWRSDSKATPKAMRQSFEGRLCLYRCLLICTSLLESVSCWLTVWEISFPENYFYNKFEAYSLALPGLDRALGAMCAINSMYLFIFWVMVTVVRSDHYRVLAWGRLFLSCGTGFVCMMLVFISESTRIFPFVSTLCSLLYLQAAVFGALVPWRGRAPSRRKACFWKSILVFLAALTVAWCMMYLLDGMAFLRESECRATQNTAMPVRIAGLTRWQCVRWKKPHAISRTPKDGDAVLEAQCSTPFHALDVPSEVGNVTVWMPSQQAHYVRCPPSCQRFNLANEVVGCHIYDSRSSVCAAAVQMGVVRSAEGGLVMVVGRAPPSAWQGCELNFVRSVENVTNMPGTAWIHDRGSVVEGQAGANSTARNTTKLGAFYFQGVLGMEQEDVVTLHSFRKVSTPGPREPYRSYVADVSWRIGGGALQRRDVTLGPAAAPDAEVELNFCHSAEPAANDCE